MVLFLKVPQVVAEGRGEELELLPGGKSLDGGLSEELGEVLFEGGAAVAVEIVGEGPALGVVEGELFFVELGAEAGRGGFGGGVGFRI